LCLYADGTQADEIRFNIFFWTGVHWGGTRAPWRPYSSKS